MISNRSRVPTNRIPTHPGEMLAEEFMKPLNLTQRAFAKHLGISTVRLNQIVRGKRGVTADTAWRLSQALGTSPDFWLNLQTAFDLATTRPRKKIQPLPELVATTQH